MRRIKAFLRLIFGFSRTETNAFLVLLPLMLIVIVSEPVYQTYFMSNKPDNFSDQKDQKELDSLVSAWGLDKEHRPGQKLAVDERNPEQFRKPERSLPKSKFSPKPKRQQVEKFDLNTADTTKLKSIYGIGPTLAKRIILYRTNLGGFISPNQLYEIWGLDSVVIARLTSKIVIAPGFMPNKLAINHCSEQDLAHHPYLRTKLARAIVNYRFQHGNFQAVDDLKKIAVMEEKIFLKIEPYITLE